MPVSMSTARPATTSAEEPENIFWAMMMTEENPILAGVVELDEMYAGAPLRKRAKPSRDQDGDDAPKTPQKRGIKRPLMLVGAERGGKVVAKVILTHGKEAIAAALDGVLDPKATVMTDGLPAYKHIGKNQPHLSVNHSDRKYDRTDAATGRRLSYAFLTAQAA